MNMFDDSEFEESEGDSPGERHIRALLARTTEPVAELLRRRHGSNLPKRPTKDRLRTELLKLLRSEILGPADLANILHALRGWGHQQVYLLQLRGSDRDKDEWSTQWSDEEWVRARFGMANLSDIFNKERNVEHSELPELFKAEYCGDSRIRFLWTERIISLVREESEDATPPPFEPSNDGAGMERIVHLAFRETEEQEVSSLELDIKNGTVTILIRKVSDRNYRDTRGIMIAHLKELLDIDKFFSPVPLRTLMQNLYLVRDINHRRKTFRSSHTGGRIAITSGTQKDLHDDNVLQQVASSLDDSADPTDTSLAWPIPERDPLGLYVYARYESDQRIGIAAQAVESDIRHVLQEIRKYSA